MKHSQQEKYVQRLAKVFRDAREAAGLSQKEVSRRAGVGRTGIIMLEQGTRIPTILTAKLIAGAIGFSLSELIERAEKTSRE